MTTITAVVESGLLRPTTPLALAEGTRVELIIVRNGGGARPQGSAAASILAEIAALHTAGGDPTTSQKHDQILYGEHGAQ